MRYKRLTTITILLTIGSLLSLLAWQITPAQLQARSDAKAPATSEATIPAAPAALASVVWSPDGQKLMLGGSFGLMHYTVVEKQLTSFAGMHGAVEDLAWSPDGARLASANAAQRVTIWEAGTGKSLASLSDYAAQMVTVSWSPDGSKIAAGSRDGRLSIWNAASYQPIATSIYTGTTFIADLAWSPDGTRLAGIDSLGLYIWNATSGTLLTTIPVTGLPNLAVAWSVDGSYLITPGPHLWEAATGQEHGSLLPCSSGTDRLSIPAPDGSRLAEAGISASNVSACLIQLDNYAWVGEIPLAMNPYLGPLSALAWSPNAAQIAGVTQRGWLYLWDAVTGDLLAMAAPPTVRRADVENIIRACVPADEIEIALTQQLVSGDYSGFITAVQNQPDQLRSGCQRPLTAMAEFFVDNPPQLDQPPIAPQALSVQGICTPHPAEYRRWVVRNPNPYDIQASWSWAGTTAPSGGYPFVVPAAVGSTAGEWQLTLPPQHDLLQIESGSFVATVASVDSLCEVYLPLVRR
ncbi:putative serine/threonine-protein kinase PkwA [Thermoflexales bacterium]|nr:putative serine/threonine-protein kinase PkwA [Thermoflexales bacterium]